MLGIEYKEKDICEYLLHHVMCLKLIKLKVFYKKNKTLTNIYSFNILYLLYMMMCSNFNNYTENLNLKIMK